jgi:prostamide/prostaglandin F2alpha synthase
VLGGVKKRLLGATDRRQETRPPARADALADLTLQDIEGREVQLGDIWRDGPAVLVFLRHYG